jgi:hypothetical protein
MTHFRRILLASCLAAMSLAGCVPASNEPSVERPTESAPAANSKPTPGPTQAAAAAPLLEVTLTGTLSVGGVSSGKTIAAWNGVPVGESFYWFTPDPGETLVRGAASKIMLRVPSKKQADALLTRRVRVTGLWNIPQPVKTQPRMPRQMPVTLGRDGSSEVVQPDVTFAATTLTEVS